MGGDTVSLLRIEQIIEARLDARPFAKQSLDGHKLGDVAIAPEGSSVAAPIETEGDADNAPLCGPCGGGCIHSGALPGGDKHHMGNARPDLVEPVPDDAPIVPVLRAGDDDDGARSEAHTSEIQSLMN